MTASLRGSPSSRSARVRALPTALVEVGVIVGVAMLWLWQVWSWSAWTSAHRSWLRAALLLTLGGGLLAAHRRRPAFAWSDVAAGALRRGTLSLLVFTLGGVMAVLSASWALGVEFRPRDGEWLGKYVAGMCLQQGLLQGPIGDRIDECLAGRPPRRRLVSTVTWCTCLFAALHLPDPLLVAMSAIGGGFWTWHFRRHRNLPGVCTSHVVLGVTAMFALGQGPADRLRVGWKALAFLNE